MNYLYLSFLHVPCDVSSSTNGVFSTQLILTLSSPEVTFSFLVGDFPDDWVSVYSSEKFNMDSKIYNSEISIKFY
jgi:hypothetical protein